MNGSILILGAGSFGQTLAETAMACGYSRISFLDDESPMAVGKLREAERFLPEYPEAIVAIGSSALRERLQRQLREWGFCLPVLMHPTAYISPTAQLGEGCFVGPKNVRRMCARSASANLGKKLPPTWREVGGSWLCV